MYSSTLFCGTNNFNSVMPYVNREQSVVYRERFARMYASWAYSVAQVCIILEFCSHLISHHQNSVPIAPSNCIHGHYMVPTSWSLNGMLTSQYGDVEKEIVVFGETKMVSAFIRDYFGYHH
ncbi:pleiotropic drug resistance 2 [Striga asiatica]|uniref:Pleiotropic drug resistance 2 n=1 Tax=Striga asiatica TaxID=4170 RepID=A0A5A7R3Q3_STRAF|nr:pleiotropic drug resistance 2 [Striga asiatica]